MLHCHSEKINFLQSGEEEGLVEESLQIFQVTTKLKIISLTDLKTSHFSSSYKEYKNNFSSTNKSTSQIMTQQVLNFIFFGFETWYQNHQFLSVQEAVCQFSYLAQKGIIEGLKTTYRILGNTPHSLIELLEEIGDSLFFKLKNWMSTYGVNFNMSNQSIL